jgi:Domain of unknown function (DUF4136)
MNARAPSHLTRHLLSAATVMLAFAACSTLQVGSDYDRSATFSSFHTFAIMQRNHDHSDRSAVRNPLVAQRVQDDIKSDLTSRGFVYTDDAAQADFVVDFTVGSRERTDIQTYPQPYAGGWWGGGPGWWGGPYWGNNVDVHQYNEGTLSIDVFDGRTHRPVWHGWAKRALSDSDLDSPEQPVREAVNSVLAKFPPMAS